jgi:hypothetical protein
MRTAMTALVVAATVGLGACASTPESRLRNDVYLDLYWTASKACEDRYRTLHVDRIGTDGGLALSADADSRSEIQSFRECYWKLVGERAQHRRSAGLGLPDDVNLKPDVDLE